MSSLYPQHSVLFSRGIITRGVAWNFIWVGINVNYSLQFQFVLGQGDKTTHKQI